MSMIDQLNKLDDLIIEHTKPPVRAMLRNQLALAREQIEAYQASSDKQDKTLTNQAVTIERLMKENADMVKKITGGNGWRELEKEAEECGRIIRKSSTLSRNV